MILLIALYKNGTRDGDCSAYTNARNTQLWSVDEEHVGNMSMCITSDGFPIGLATNPDKDYGGPSNVGVATFRFLFNNVTLGPQSIIDPACPTCAAATPCPGEGIISMEVVRMSNGGGEPLDQIWNLDIADVAGEIMFNHGFNHTYLKVFNVTVNSSWGP